MALAIKNTLQIYFYLSIIKSLYQFIVPVFENELLLFLPFKILEEIQN